MVKQKAGKKRGRPRKAASVKSELVIEPEPQGSMATSEVLEEALPPAEMAEAAKPPESAQCPNCKRIVVAARIFRCASCGKDGCDRCGWDALTLRKCPSCGYKVGG